MFVEDSKGGRRTTQVGEAPARATVLTLADVEAQMIEFLWPPYISWGKLTLLEGDGVVGKSFLLGAVSTAVSNGRMPRMEGGLAVRGKAESVLILLGEDGIAGTIRPRLEAMGASLNNIKILTGILTEGAELPLLLDEAGLEDLNEAIAKLCYSVRSILRPRSLNASVMTGAASLASSNAGTEYEHQGSRYYLEVKTGCRWQATVKR